MVEYRRLRESHRETFHEYVSYAFQPDEGPPEYDPEEHDTERANLGDRRGLFDDGAPDDADPRCVCAHYWFDARVRGDVHPTPGLSAVASPPENRRDGFVRRLLEASLEEYRDRDARFSVLWPFRYRFYRKFGWDTANGRLEYECDPEAFSFATDAVDDRGSYRRLEADDYAALVPVYEAHTRQYALTLERDEAWWKHRIFTGWENDPFVYVWERDGEVAGYLVYEIDGDWGDRTMHVSELAFVDHESFLALLSFCHTHDSQVSSVKLTLPEGTPLLELVPAPEELECELKTGPMVRIVDVAETLAALSYPNDVTASVTLAVEDPIVERNDGPFGLEVVDGEATCERRDATEDEGRRVDAVARIDVAALSQLAVGYRAATDLEWAGRLEGESGGVKALETLFPETDVYLRDGF